MLVTEILPRQFSHHFNGNILRQSQNLSKPKFLISGTNLLPLDLLAKWSYWLSSGIAGTRGQTGINTQYTFIIFIRCTFIIFIGSLQFTCSFPRVETFRPPPQFLTLLAWIFSLSFPSEHNPVFTINQHPWDELKLQPKSSTAVMVSVSCSFQLLAG